jgi:Flp pilus assembly protein TadG
MYAKTKTQPRGSSAVLARGRDPRQGVITILMAICCIAMIALAGLATDLARMYVAKNELQNYTDAAALAGVIRLDGTLSGISNATTDANEDNNAWNFDTSSVDDVAVEFGLTINGPWEASPALATGYRFIRVSAEADVPIYLTRILPGVGPTKTITARSVSGLVFQDSMSDGIFPFSPDAHDSIDPNFGFLMGKYYTLRYDKAVGSLSGVLPSPTTYLLSLNDKKLIGCPGDMEKAPAFRPGNTVGSGSSAERGYIDLGSWSPTNPGGGANLIVDGIMGRVSYGQKIEIGQTLVMEPGNKSTIESAIVDRVEQDTNGMPGSLRTPRYYSTQQTAPNVPTEEAMKNLYRTAYDTYFPRPPGGNGRRIVTVPVNDPANNNVVGFAAFFLPLNPCEDSPQYNGRRYNPCCGEYIGSVTLNGGAAPGPGAALFRPVLLQ